MNANNESSYRRLTLADFEGIDISPILKSRGETLESIQQLEREYAVAEKNTDEKAKKRLDVRLQPIYQRLASLHRGTFRS